jgi:hypothetical protein
MVKEHDDERNVIAYNFPSLNTGRCSERLPLVMSAVTDLQSTPAAVAPRGNRRWLKFVEAFVTRCIEFKAAMRLRAETR